MMKKKHEKESFIQTDIWQLSLWKIQPLFERVEKRTTRFCLEIVEKQSLNNKQNWKNRLISALIEPSPSLRVSISTTSPMTLIKRMIEHNFHQTAVCPLPFQCCFPDPKPRLSPPWSFHGLFPICACFCLLWVIFVVIAGGSLFGGVSSCVRQVGSTRHKQWS